MMSLIQRLNLSQNGNAPRLIAFIAARPREGTTTVARSYAEALAVQTRQKILLIDAGGQPLKRFWHTPRAALGIVDAILSELPPSDAIESNGPFLSTARWVCHEANHAVGSQMIRDEKLWNLLLESYNTIIIDSPSLQSSYDGVMLATQAKATLLVIEAEKTPQAVVQNLKETLSAANASIVGIIMNKRRFYIPERVYKRL